MLLRTFIIISMLMAVISSHAKVILTVDSTQWYQTWTGLGMNFPGTQTTTQFSNPKSVLDKGVLKVNPQNPRYFTDDSGKAIYLAGINTGGIQDLGYGYPQDAKYVEFLDKMKSYGLNYNRMWYKERPKYKYRGFRDYVYVEPFPWPRTGPGNANDGKPKFNLSQFNQDYFARLRSAVIAAGERGIYVSIMLFEGHALVSSAILYGWESHPFNVNNNVNGINGDVNGDAKGLEYHTMACGEDVLALQEAYVRKVIDTVNDLDNVMYEIANEAAVHSQGETVQDFKGLEWQYHMIDLIKNYEASKPKQHPVGITCLGNDNSVLFNSVAEWLQPNRKGETEPYSYIDNPRPTDGSKVIIADTDHIAAGHITSQIWAWKCFTRGLNTSILYYADRQGHDFISKVLGHILTYAKKIDLEDMIPSETISSTKYCLANPGKEYIIYQPENGSFSVDLSDSAEIFTVEWFNTRTGQMINGGTVQGGEKRTLSPPWNDDVVAYLIVITGTNRAELH